MPKGMEAAMALERYAQRYGVQPDAGAITTRAWRHWRYVEMVEELAAVHGFGSEGGA